MEREERIASDRPTPHVEEDGYYQEWPKPRVGEVGIKYDDGKIRYDLVPVRAMEDWAKVISLGARKYGENNWQKLKNPRSRYYAALMRHLVSWWRGEEIDPESGLPHLAHVMCNASFLMHFDDQFKEGEEYESRVQRSIQMLKEAGFKCKGPK